MINHLGKRRGGGKSYYNRIYLTELGLIIDARLQEGGELIALLHYFTLHLVISFLGGGVTCASSFPPKRIERFWDGFG